MRKNQRKNVITALNALSKEDVSNDAKKVLKQRSAATRTTLIYAKGQKIPNQLIPNITEQSRDKWKKSRLYQ